MSEDEKEKIEPILLSNTYNVYSMEVLIHFGTKVILKDLI